MDGLEEFGVDVAVDPAFDREKQIAEEIGTEHAAGHGVENREDVRMCW